MRIVFLIFFIIALSVFAVLRFFDGRNLNSQAFPRFKLRNVDLPNFQEDRLNEQQSRLRAKMWIGADTNHTRRPETKHEDHSALSAVLNYTRGNLTYLPKLKIQTRASKGKVNNITKTEVNEWSIIEKITKQCHLTHFDLKMSAMEHSMKLGLTRAELKTSVSMPPVVIFSGRRHMYLSQLLENLQRAFVAENIAVKPPCIFSFDIPLHLVNNHFDAFCKSLQIASSTDFCQMHARIRFRKTHLRNHGHMKEVWIKTMEYVWDDLLSNYDGDVLFLEDDVVPSPDFYMLTKKLSRLKRKAYSNCVLHNTYINASSQKKSDPVPQVFSLGGWGGENTILAQPTTVLQKTSENFPTMGYGFGRSMWKYIRQLSDKFLKNRHNDWAVAVAECLWQFPKNLSVKQCELSGFLKTSQIETYQPSLSRVWHIGRNSTVGSSHSTHVQARPPWSDQRLLGKENITENITVAIGRHDWFGFPCNYMGRDPAICVGQFSGHFPFSKRHSVNFNPILKHGGP